MKRKTIIILISMLTALIVIVQSCVSTKVAEKSGTQLWSENCQRCHNAPPSTSFSDTQWEVINAHMRVRAQLTKDECKKITDFMQAGD